MTVTYIHTTVYLNSLFTNISSPLLKTTLANQQLRARQNLQSQIYAEEYTTDFSLDLYYYNMDDNSEAMET